jgi:hypothetical protein
MSRFHGFAAALGLVASALAFPSAAQAQYSSVTGPLNNVGSSYYEQIGLGFGGNIGNHAFFNNGGAGGAWPGFGGGAPGGGANFGWGIQGSGVNLNFGLHADSGSDRSISSVSPSVTIPNGGTGGFFSGSQRPFVTGLVPVVGSFSPGVGYTMAPPRTTSPLVERLVRLQDEIAVAARNKRPGSATSEDDAPSAPLRPASSAEHGDLSLSAIRAQQANVVDAEAAELAGHLEAARLREEAGEYGQALIDYGRAAARAEGPLREELRIKMRELRAQMKK